MHEASIAQSIIENLERRIVEGQIAGRVCCVYLMVGRLTAVVPDNLQFMFGVLARDSVLNDARLEIELVPVRARCRTCRAEFEIEDIYFLCAACGSANLDILSGRELLIESVEVE